MSQVICTQDSGDTALMLMGTTFVFLQTPGIGLAQAGLVRRKNSLSLLMQCMAGMVIGSLLWFAFGYSLTFGPSQGGMIGNLDYAFLHNITHDRCYEATDSFSHFAFVAFQMMFALMVPVIITGAWAEKMTFRAFIVFIILWPIFVYYPLAHWVWNPKGWLAEFGTKDFAGGITIHTASGVSALVVAKVIQRRKDHSQLGEARHNLPLTVVGSSLIWGGWYSFNGASAFAANGNASIALVNTHVSACTGSMVWVILTFLADRHWHLTELINGGFVGLAAITPASGFVEPWVACFIGFVASVFGYFGVRIINLVTDDVLDVSSLQGIPGITGSILLGFFARDDFAGGGNDRDGVFYAGIDKTEGWRFLAAQVVGVLIAIVWSGFWTFAIMIFMKIFVGINVKAETEEIGLDLWQIGEQAYDDRLELKLDVGAETLNQKFLEAVARGDAVEVFRLVDAGADVDFADYDGRTAAHIASSEGRFDLLKSMHARYHMNLNGRDRWSGTPLRDAVRHEHDKIVKWLTDNGAEMDTEGDACHELMNASASGDVASVRRLLQAGADPNAGDYDHRTALMVAASEGRSAVVQMLLENGAKISLKDRWGFDAYDSAVKNNSHQAGSIIANWANRKEVPNTDEKKSKNKKDKKDPKVVDSASANGETPAMNGNENGVDVIKMQPLDVKLTKKQEHAVSTSTRELCIAASNGNINEMKRLIKKGGKAGRGDYDHRTPLHLAAVAGHQSAIHYLLQQSDVNVNAQDRWNNTALSEAIANNHFELAEYLRRNGAINTNGNIGSKLCAAAAEGDLEELKRMDAQGVSMNVGDYDMRTPLHLACAEGKSAAAEWLTNIDGIILNVRDRWGNTPQDDAKREGYPDLAAMMAKAEKDQEERKAGDDSGLKPTKTKKSKSKSKGLF